MATLNDSQRYQVFEHSVLNNLKSMLWGTSLKEDVFLRWSQGFIFSDSTPTALVQYEGGPCAVIAPVQAFLVKCALFGEGSPSIDALRIVSSERANAFLLEALTEILAQMNNEEYILVCLNGQPHIDLQTTSSNQLMEESGQSSATHSHEDNNEGKSTQPASGSEDSFHSRLRYLQCRSVADLHTALRLSLPEWQSSHGVLLFLYSILLTKGIQQIKNEVEDPSEPLIDGIYGHGSQSLINLLLTSQATSNVWDNDKDISGLTLRGIKQQSTIGFLTLLEHMRYCEVGWYLKNPKFPIWILGSETHLTVLFSTTESLVVKESPERNAKHVFAQFDPEGNGFISSALLEDILQALDLVSEKEYVEIMRTKLDSEELGIITRNSFLEEFFPEHPVDSTQSFTLFHYNGLPQSCPGGKVSFSEGKAVLAEELDTQFITDTSPIKLCLQTKWPSIEVTWSTDKPPSLN